MNHEQAQEVWAEALDSGGHVQGKGRLQKKHRFCCLGIACLIAEQHGVFVNRALKTGEIVGSNLTSQPAVKEWLGLKNACGGFLESQEEDVNMDLATSLAPVATALTELNDDYYGKGSTFTQIAAIIRSKPKGLFV